MICIFVGTSTESAISGLLDGRLDNYDCKSEQDAISCNNKCKRMKSTGIDFQNSFKINVAKNIVMHSQYNNGENFSNSILENCQIVDEKNWICKDSFGGKWVTQQMKNGVYSFVRPDDKAGSFMQFSCSK